MSTSYRNINLNNTEVGKDVTIAILVSEWNNKITDSLKDAALKTLNDNGIDSNNIIVKYVPGSFELPSAAKFFIDYKNVDAVICLGCVIEGETRHFDYVCQGVTQGVMDLNINTNTPVIFGVLTTKDLAQAQDRAGGKHGNKGEDAAVAALKMINLKNSLQS